MKNLFLSFVIAGFVFNVSSVKAGASMGKAAELGLHRVERLVALKKIDETFITRLQTITLKMLDPSQNAGASYSTIIGQQGNEGTDALRIEIKQDGNGRALNFTLLPGTAPANPIMWSAKDPLSLTEMVLHHVTEAGHGDMDFSDFDKGMTDLTMNPVTTSNGEIAQATIHSSLTTKVLVIWLQMDGTFISAHIQ